MVNVEQKFLLPSAINWLNRYNNEQKKQSSELLRRPMTDHISHIHINHTNRVKIPSADNLFSKWKYSGEKYANQSFCSLRLSHM